MGARDAMLVALAIICAAAVLASPVACTMRRQALVAETVRSGVDPIGAKCAIESAWDRDTICLMYAAQPRAASGAR